MAVYTMFYTVLFLTATTLLFLSSYYKGNYNIFLFLFFLIIFLVPGFRGDVGQDTYSYMVHYQKLVDTKALMSLLSEKEPLLYLIMYPHKLIFNSYTSFLVVVALIQSSLLYYSTKRIYHRAYFLFFYSIIFFFEFHFNVLRVGLAALFFLCALSEVNNSNKKVVLFLVLSALSHISILIVFPVLAVRAKANKMQYIILTFFLIILVAIVYFLFKDIIEFKFEAYNLFDFDTVRIPLLVTALLSITWISYFFSKGLSSQIKVSLIIFSLGLLYSGVSAIAYRFSMLALIVLLYIVSDHKIMTFSKLRFKYFYIGFLSILLLSSYNIIYGIILEPTKRMQPGAAGLADFTYYPYSLYYESKYRENL